MKKYYFLIIVALILGLVLTGCSLLSNIGQAPATEQSGISYLTKGPLSVDLVGLVGLWHFDEGEGLIAYDSSGNSNDGTIHGAGWVSGLCGSALSFDGDDYVDCGPSVDDDITTGITLEACIKPEFKQNGGIVSNDITFSSKKGYDFFLWFAHGSYGRLYIDFGNGSTLGRIGWDIPSLDWYNQWHHVAATWDGSVIKLYADGSKVAEVGYSGTYSAPGKNTFIGAINLTSAHYNFDGLIDEVRIWDGALTAEQIEDSFSYGIVIQKGMSKDDAVLGDHVKITLEVVTAQPASVLITDVLPDELRYIPGTFEVDGFPATPTVDGQTISYTLDQPCAYTITFDAQVTSAEADDNTVKNTATATATEGDVSASAKLTIHPYEGFKKEVDDKYEDTKDGKVEVGELVQWVMTITVHNNFAWPISNATLSDRLGGELGMAGDGVDNDLDGDTDDGEYGDLDLDYNIIPSGTLDILVRGKANKVHFKITEIYIGAFEGSCFDLGIFTDKNPAGKQCYTTDAIYEINSGAVLKFIDPDPDGPGFQLSAHTPPITVEVTEP